MATAKKIEELLVWQKSRTLYKEIFEAAQGKGLREDHILRNQIFRASGSIMDNIAEGFERGGKKEFRQFLSIAKGSSGEVRSQLYRALDSNYLEQTDFQRLYHLVDEISRMLFALIRSLNQQENNGWKYK